MKKIKDINWRRINDFPYDMPEGVRILIYTENKLLRETYSQEINVHTDYCRTWDEKITHWAFANLPE